MTALPYVAGRASGEVDRARSDSCAFDPDFVGPRHRLRERLLLQALLGARPGRVVLNAGAGQGTFSQLLEERGFNVTSLDSSSWATELLRRRVGGTVVCASVEAMPFDDHSFDALVLGEVLEHVENDLAALGEVVRVLRPRGIVAISVPANPRYFGPSDRWAGHFRRYTREGLLSVSAAAGLRVERLSPWGFPCSALYHRFLYDKWIGRVGALPPKRASKPAHSALGLLLNIDRLFVGVERGALGYLLIARA